VPENDDILGGIQVAIETNEVEGMGINPGRRAVKPFPWKSKSENEEKD